jgi:hypothetical protein
MVAPPKNSDHCYVAFLQVLFGHRQVFFLVPTAHVYTTGMTGGLKNDQAKPTAEPL